MDVKNGTRLNANLTNKKQKELHTKSRMNSFLSFPTNSEAVHTKAPSRRLRIMFAVTLLIAALFGMDTGFAHHAFMSEYDPDQITTFKGAVTRFEWANPHCHVFVDVKDGSESVTTWDFEMGGPGILVQNGWEKTTLHTGDLVSVRAARARNGSKKASAREITLPNGMRLGAASPVDGGPQ